MSESGVRAFDTNALEWVQLDQFPAIQVKVVEDRASHPALSLLVVRVAPGGVIDTHTHPVETETALVTAGQGVLTWGDDQHETPVALGQGITIRPGTPHSLRNTGATPLELLAVHTPAVR
jgi:mannose-6-phosphate isomerase-like protein (cupin superfamily)